MLGNLNVLSRSSAIHRHLISEVYKFATLSENPITASCGIRGWMHSLKNKNSLRNFGPCTIYTSWNLPTFPVLQVKKISPEERKGKNYSNLQRGTAESGDPSMQSWNILDSKMSLSFFSPLNPVANMTKSVSSVVSSPWTLMPSLQKLKLGAFFSMMLPSSTLS